MDLMEAIRARHSVRRYEETPIQGETLRKLEEVIAAVNEESGLHIQLVTDEPKAFQSRLARYGSFSGVRNYLVLVGKKSAQLEEMCGYYGEKIVLEAQRLGLNTCWVALTYKKIPEAFSVEDGEKLTVVIAIGYGENQGNPRKSKGIREVTRTEGEVPLWFTRGAEAALLAPTAVNQQKFRFTRKGNTVSAKAGFGVYTKMDLGIAKYHFEIGAGKENFSWQ